MKKGPLIIFLAVSVFSKIFGQSIPYSRIVPPSPDAASLAKYIDFPVNLYNGIPEINIPIHTIDVGEMQVPISLSYHAGGITVSDIPSWVGTGFSLNAGGVITRSMRGQPDDLHGYFENNFNGDKLPSCDAPNYDFFNRSIQPVAVGNYQTDIEPDVYYISAPGISGQLVFDKTGKIRTNPYRNVDIQVNSFAGISKWTVTLENGVKYIFNETESTMDQIVTQYEDLSGSSNTPIQYNSSWYLSEILLPNGISGVYTITFSYEPTSLTYSLPGVDTKFDDISATPYGGQSQVFRNFTTHSTTFVWGKRLRKITYPGGHVDFVPGLYRYDLQGSQFLDSIKISSDPPIGSGLAVTLVKSFKFNYGYFGNSSIYNIAQYSNATATTAANTVLRLALLSLKEYGSSGSSEKPPYAFSYENNAWLPDRMNSKAIDHWGYYNGKANNSTLIPWHFAQRISSTDKYEVNGALRYSDLNSAKAGTIKRITYPTGGYTEFVFDLNEADATSQSSLQYQLNEITSQYGITTCHIISPLPFDVNDQVDQKVTFTTSLTGGPDWPWPNASAPQTCNGVTRSIDPTIGSSWITFDIYNITDPAHPFKANTSILGGLGVQAPSTQFTIELPNGKYQIKAFVGGQELTDSYANVYAGFFFKIRGVEEKLIGPTVKIGGLRIKQKTDFDPVTQTQLIRIYDYTDSGLSSGKVISVPKYDAIKKATVREFCGQNPALGNTFYYLTSTQYSSTSVNTLSKMGGGNVGYSKVTEYIGMDNQTGEIGTNGRTEYYFANSFPDVLNGIGSASCFSPYYFAGNFPGAPVISMDWKRGLLTQKINYSRGNIKVNEVINSYKTDYLGDYAFNPVVDAAAAKIFIDNKIMGRDICVEGSPIAPDLVDSANPILGIASYFIPCRLSNLVRSEERSYGLNGEGPHITIKEYNYDNPVHLQLTSSTITLSNNEKKWNRMLYPDDYSDNGNGSFVSALKTAHIVKPVEQISYVTDASGSNPRVVSGEITSYKTGSLIGLPDKIYKLETTTPITSFTLSNGLPLSGGTPGLFTFGNTGYHSTWANYSFEFDTYRNVVQVLKDSDVPTSYYWAYNSTYPVIKAIGVNSTDLQTAVQSVIGTSTIEAKLESDWLNLTSSLQNHVLLKNAHVTVYAYTPMVGMQKSSDANSKSFYFSYDEFNRLKTTKDNNSNIIKAYDYHYKQ